MEKKENARRAEDLGNLQHDERMNRSNDAANKNDTADVPSEDDCALRLAREWRDGKQDAWLWLVGCLVRAQHEGRTYESFRRLTDELSQIHDFTDDEGRRVTVPHNRLLGRGLALLVCEECPSLAPMLRMRGPREREAE